VQFGFAELVLQLFNITRQILYPLHSLGFPWLMALVFSGELLHPMVDAPEVDTIFSTEASIGKTPGQVLSYDLLSF
jgi:hypothetical protein